MIRKKLCVECKKYKEVIEFEYFFFLKTYRSYCNECKDKRIHEGVNYETNKLFTDDGNSSFSY